MIKKSPVKNSDKVSVTFETAAFPSAATVHLAGEFNDWDPATHALKQRKDGAWSITLRLPRDQRYQYRFVVDGRDWVADEDADATVPNEFGGVNSVVSIG